MYKSIALLTLAAFSAVEAGLSPQIVRRQFRELTCSESGLKDCGSNCIYLSDICCPSGGGCQPGTYCDGDGCCPIGKTCRGGGGIITIPGQIITSTKAINVPVPTPSQTVGRPAVPSSPVIGNTVIPTPSPRPTPTFTPILSLETPTTSDSTSSSTTSPIIGIGVPTTRPNSPLLGSAADRNMFNMCLVFLPFLFV